ncbi:MAG: helix-turn-helix transcriptional regulator [Methylococcales bacterium]|nr:helix-turn-helix transcriptional regulator [Methylococcales bacterium]
MSVNEKIRLIRESKGVTQEDIAKKLDISVNSYGDIERGNTNLKLNRLEQIAEILGVQLPELVDSSDNGSLNTCFNKQVKQRDVYFKSSTIELEKQQLINELLLERIAMKDNEIENLKTQIIQLQKINALLEKNQ